MQSTKRIVFRIASKRRSEIVNLKRRISAAMMLFLFSAATVLPCGAFKTSSPFDPIHTEIMNTALAPVGFQPDAIKDVDEGAASQDNPTSWKMFAEEHHFDGNNIIPGYNYVRSQIKNSINTARDCYKDPKELHDARFKLGEAYHALQDFYSHSNWLEMCLYDRVTPTVFRWDLHSAFDQKNSDGNPEWFTAPLRNMPPRLKTGYFTNAEAGAAGTEILQDFTRFPVDLAKQMRFLMVKEALEKHPGLKFAPEELYMERIKGTDSFYRALSYVVDDENRAVLHWEINKDDDHQIEGRMRAPTGETLHELAKQLAIKDTQLFWQAHVERLMWHQYQGCANLIIPAFKGNPLPELILNVNVNQLYTPSRTQPLEGTISVRMSNMMQRAKYPLKVLVKTYLEPVDMPGSAESSAQVKTLEFKTNDEQKIDLKPMVLVIGRQDGNYRLVVTASYECDPSFRPVTRKFDFSGGKLGLVSATVAPNPALAGEGVNLKVEYTYTGEKREVMKGSGTIEAIDGSYKHTFNTVDLPGDGTGWFKPYQEAYTPPQAGKYIWYPRITSTSGDEIKTSVPFEVANTTEKSIKSTSAIDKTSGQVGDSFVLGVDYEISGAPRAAQLVASETSSLQQIDGPLTPLGQTNVTLTSSGLTPTKSRRLWKFQATKPGIYDWSYQISVPGFGSTTGSQRIVVLSSKQLVIDSESITPTPGPTGPSMALRVTYHIDGLSNQDSVGVSETSSIIRGPAGKNFPLTMETLTQGHPGNVLENTFIATMAGDYEWSYTIDAGPFGRITQSLPFRIDASQVPVPSTNTALRNFEIISATVAPASGPVGSGFQLNVRYIPLNLGSNEGITVEENDYVNFGQKTETHQTTVSNASQGRPLMSKAAAFVSKQSGRHIWNYTLTAPGFRTHYGFVPFDVDEVQETQRLSAQLEFSEITLAPGENKSCNVFISGYRGNTADPVEIIYPQVDSWGTLPGQVQVFPANEAMLPQNMRGAGDFTRQYAAGRGYRAKETAQPGISPVKIIVRQKDAGQVELTLFVKVVKRGENTTGTEKPGLSGETGNTTGSGSGSGAGTAGTTTSSGPTAGANPAGGAPTAAGSAGGAQNGATPGTSAGSSGVAGANQVVYVFKRATVAVTPVTGISATGYSPTADAVPRMVNFTTTEASVPVTWNENKQGRAGTAQQTVNGTVSFKFPEKLVLNSYQTDPTSYTGNADINCKATASFTRSGPGSAFNSGPVGVFVGEATGGGATTNSSIKDSRSSYFNGGANFNLAWNVSPMVAERAEFKLGAPAHQPRLLLQNLGQTVVGIGGNDNGFTARVVAAQELEYVASPGTDTTGESVDDSVKSAQIIATLDPSKIILEAGKLPGTSINIMLTSWKRDTAEPIEITYPGLGPMNMLPNGIRAVYAGGTQSPDALSRLQTDNGAYRWPQSFEAIQGATPGTYKIPISIKQKGAAPTFLELEVQIIPSKNAKFGNSTALFNKGAAGGTPATNSGGIWGQGWKPKANTNSAGMTPVPVAAPVAVPVAPPKAPAITVAPAATPVAKAPMVPVGPRPGAQSKPSCPQKPATAGAAVFRRTGPFINTTRGPEGGGDWRIELLGDSIKYTKLDFYAVGKYNELSSTIKITIPPETISPGQMLHMSANMSGDPSVYGAGFWSMDGAWIRQTAQMQGISPHTPILSTNETFMVRKVQDALVVGGPWLQYNTIFGVPKMEVLWRYEKVK